MGVSLYLFSGDSLLGFRAFLDYDPAFSDTEQRVSLSCETKMTEWCISTSVAFCYKVLLFNIYTTHS